MSVFQADVRSPCVLSHESAVTWVRRSWVLRGCSDVSDLGRIRWAKPGFASRTHSPTAVTFQDVGADLLVRDGAWLDSAARIWTKLRYGPQSG